MARKHVCSGLYSPSDWENEGIVAQPLDVAKWRFPMDRIEIEECLKSLAKGNTIAKHWSKEILGNRRLDVLHYVMGNPSKSGDKVTAEELEKIRAIPQDDAIAIRATWDASEKLWNQYKRLIYRLASKFHMKVGLPDQQLVDLQSESMVCYLKAVRGYSDLSYNFGTYLGRCIYTGLRRYLQKGRGFKGANEALMIKYKEMNQHLAIQGLPHDFDAICVEMQLSEKQRMKLWDSIQEPVSENELAESLDKVVTDKSSNVNNDLITAIGMVELSLLERDAFISSDEVRGLFPDSYETFKEVGSAHSVTAAAAAAAAGRAREKIAKHLRHQGFALA